MKLGLTAQLDTRRAARRKRRTPAQQARRARRTRVKLARKRNRR